MDWRTVAHEFEPDGSLRDIYVLETDLSDWQRLLDALRSPTSVLVYEVDQVVVVLPDQVEEIFAEREQNRVPLLRAEVNGVTLVCHFFTPDEIEFDFRPDEVTGSEQLEPLLGFMRTLGEATAKTVILTPENQERSPIFRFDPCTDTVMYLPSPT